MRGQKSEVGDTRTSPNGYHYTRIETGWELTARLVAGEHRGSALLPNERVRFNDGDRTNLDPDNIVVYTVRAGSKAKRLARVEARIKDLEAERDAILAEEE